VAYSIKNAILGVVLINIRQSTPQIQCLDVFCNGFTTGSILLNWTSVIESLQLKLGTQFRYGYLTRWWKGSTEKGCFFSIAPAYVLKRAGVAIVGSMQSRSCLGHHQTSERSGWKQNRKI